MLQDYNRGMQTEIEAITGQIIRYGEKCGIPTPFNRAVYALLKTRLQARQTNLLSEKRNENRSKHLKHY